MRIVASRMLHPKNVAIFMAFLTTNLRHTLPLYFTMFSKFSDITKCSGADDTMQKGQKESRCWHIKNIYVILTI